MSTEDFSGKGCKWPGMRLYLDICTLGIYYLAIVWKLV